eukprot:scaffold32796_cov48-Phaeocystis_antarctica.AAC.1
MSSLLALDREFAPCRVARRAYGARQGVARKGGRRRATAAQAGRRGECDCRLGAGHGEERTSNIQPKLVTLEVSKLSGWLNAFAFCRGVERGAYGAGQGAAREAGGGGRRRCTQRAGEGLDCRFGAGHGEERTQNIWAMCVTLEVSKLSGWLNAYASCRESKGGHAVRGEVRPGRAGGRRATAGHAACRGGLDCRLGAGHGEERTMNMWAMNVTLEVSKLSGWLNADAYCREPKGGHAVRGERSGQQTGATATGVERTESIFCMFVTLDVSKLSGWLNADAPCREPKGGHTYGAGRGCGPADGCDGVQRAVEGSTADWGQNRRGAHKEHIEHGCDAGGVPVGNVRIEILQVMEKLAHVGDGRDAPVGDGSVRCNGGSRVSVEGSDRRLQGGCTREGVRR